MSEAGKRAMARLRLGPTQTFLQQCIAAALSFWQLSVRLVNRKHPQQLQYKIA